MDAEDLARSHLRWFLDHAPFGAGGHGSGDLWISSLSLETGRHPVGDRPEGIEKRCYRYIEAPHGSNLYWDLPLVAACHAIAEVDGDEAFRRPARAYVGEFLTRCRADDGLFWWGNHYYVDAASNDILWFYGGDTVPTPIGPDHPRPWLHEIRPLRIPWGLLAEVDATAVCSAIGAMAEHHVYDLRSGGFNRHADDERGFAFIEAGGILAESLCWGAQRFDRPAWTETALRIAEYSYSHRDATTDLMSNSPDVARWDQTCSTSEVGLWARCLMHAAELSGVQRFVEMATAALGAWLDHAWDDDRTAFHGMLDLRTGRPIPSDPDYLYQPHDHCDPWEPVFPAHDYPLPCAEACLDAWELTGDERFRLGVERWVAQLRASLPARGGRGAYAEHYGRALRFVRRVSAADACPVADLDVRLETEALTVLARADGRLRSHPGEDRCDAVDGMGFLLLALARLERSDDPTIAEIW